MSSQNESPHPHTPLPTTPEGQSPLSSPVPQSNTPITPPSCQQPNTLRFDPRLGSPFEAPNDKQWKSSGQLQNQISRPEIDPSMVRAIQEYCQQQSETEHRDLLEKVRDLNAQLEDSFEHIRELESAYNPKYIESLESEHYELEKDYRQLQTNYDDLKLSDQFKSAEIRQLNRDLQCALETASTAKIGTDESAYSKLEQENRNLRKQINDKDESYEGDYDVCLALQTANEELKAQIARDATTIQQLQAMQANNESTFSQQDFNSIHTKVQNISNQLSTQVELRKAREGSMLVDHTSADHRLEILSKQVQELKKQNRAQQDEIEALRAAASDNEHSRDIMQSHHLPHRTFTPMPSLEEELGEGESCLEEEDNHLQETFHPQESSSERPMGLDKQYGMLYSSPKESSFDSETCEPELQDTRQEPDSLFGYGFPPPSATTTSHGSTFVENRSDGTDNPVMNYNLDNTQLEQPVAAKQLYEPIWARISRQLGNVIAWITNVVITIACGKTSKEEKLESHNADASPCDSAEVLSQDQPASFLQALQDSTDLWHKYFHEGINSKDDDIVDILGADLNVLSNMLREEGSLIIKLARIAQSIGSRIWAKISCLEDKDRQRLITLGPFVLHLIFFGIAWWSISAAVAERYLWIQSNEVSYDKYRETSIWGAERGFTWTLLYGLGFF